MTEPVGWSIDAGADAELVLRLHQQEVVAAFGLQALREDNLDAVLAQACIVVAGALGSRFAKVLTYRPASTDLLVSHGVGWRDGVVGRAVLGCDLASPAGYALQTGVPVVSNHLGVEARFRSPALLAEHGVHRAINVIIEGADGPFGVLEADSTDRLAFSEHDIAFMQSIANVLSAAIDRNTRQASQRAMLAEKDLLMQEVHHRVKNSLQLVQTMLQLQARGAAPDERDRLQDAARRIMTIAAVHRRLHQEGSVQATEAGAYFEALLADIRVALVGGEAARPLTLQIEPMTLLPDQITPLGLITTELITNALKYGKGAIAVALARTPDGVAITVEDQGAGFPSDFDPVANHSLGMRLISAMARSADAIVVDRTVPFGRISVRVVLPA